MQGGRINIFYQIDKMKKKKSKLKIKTKNDGGKRMEKNIQKSSKGITLIALVITVIVILILARSNNFTINWK